MGVAVRTEKYIGAVGAYVRDLNRNRHTYDKLDIDELKRIGKKIRKGDEEARKHLIVSHTKLVLSVAGNYKGRVNERVGFEDIVSQGNIGLIKAADKYDSDKGYKFSTYATWWIRQSITRFLVENSRVIRAPVYISELIPRYEDAFEYLLGELGRPPTVSELMDYTGIDDRKVDRIQKFIAMSFSSLEQRIYYNDGGKLEEIIPSGKDDLSEESNKQIVKEEIKNLMGQVLNEREYIILIRRYGVDDGRNYTLDEIGRIMNLSRERIRQIQKIAEKKLRRGLLKRAQLAEELAS